MPSRAMFGSVLVVGGALVGTCTTGLLVGRETNAPAVQPVAAAETRPAVPATAPVPDAKAQPGKVHWHPTLDAARAAAAKSGKPVLLFHMMGRLDQTFC